MNTNEMKVRTPSVTTVARNVVYDEGVGRLLLCASLLACLVCVCVCRLIVCFVISFNIHSTALH